jgi:hypothetical protein
MTGMATVTFFLTLVVDVGHFSGCLRRRIPPTLFLSCEDLFPGPGNLGTVWVSTFAYL